MPANGLSKHWNRLHKKLDEINKDLLSATLSERDLEGMLGKDKRGLLHRSGALFYFLPHIMGHLMHNDPDQVLSRRSIRFRSGLPHHLIMTFGRLFLGGKKLSIERRESLPTGRPIIFAPNHCFVEDALSSVLVAEAPAYLMFGTLPHFFNTRHGIAAYMNGSILINRKDKESRQAIVDKAVKALELGTNLIMYAEGTWNKTPNKLVLNYWSGICRIAQKTNALIVPIVHLPVGNVIHSSRLAPFDISRFGDDFQEALATLRDIISTELFELMSKYSVGKRADIIGSHRNMHEACEAIISEQIRTAGRFYDYEIEAGDATLRTKHEPFEVWQPIANISPTAATAGNVLYAQKLLQEDYQHRF